MHPIYFAAAFWLAAFGCLSLGKTHPRRLRYSDARFIAASILLVIGLAGCAALTHQGVAGNG